MSNQTKETAAQKSAFRGRLGFSNTARSPRPITEEGLKRGKNRAKIERIKELRKLEADWWDGLE